MNPRLSRHYEDLEQSLLAQGRAAGVLTSSTSIGRARELIVNDFLRPHLPQRLSVVRGELIDSKGDSSGELDTMLRDNQSLAWGVGGESLLPVEAAVGVIEVKSSLDGDNLQDAIRKIARAKRLERLPHHGFYVPTDDAHVEIPPRRTRGYVVAFAGPNWENVATRLRENLEWVDQDYLTLGPEVLLILGRGLIYKNDNEIFQVPPDARDNFAQGLHDRPGVEAIAMHITETVRRYGQITYDLTGYMS